MAILSTRLHAWMTRRAVILAVVSASAWAWAGEEPPLDGLTFHAEPDRLFVPLEEAARELRWKIERDVTGVVTVVNGRPVLAAALRTLTDGTLLAGLEELKLWGATVVTLPGSRAVTVQRAWREFTVVAGLQRVEISLGTQQLRAWQGDRLVLQTRISSGKKRGSTPTGIFRAGPLRERMHYSRRYHNAPMPWSVQIHGHVFIHGFTSVPAYPASHGCIRVPLTEGNPAKFFYEWVQTGTTVRVAP